MTKYFLLACLFITACNPVDKGEQGYRQNQEEESAPNDYTEGTDTRTPPTTNR